MTGIYLDQWVWIQLARTRLGRESSVSREVRDELAARRLAGDVAFPLSEVHYIETWRQRRVDRRSELAVEMGLLSAFITLAPIRAIWPGELDRALHRRFARPDDPPPTVPFGRGVSFAMAQPARPEINALDSETRFLLEWELLRSPDQEMCAAEAKQTRERDEELARNASKTSEAMKAWGVPGDEKVQRFRIQTLGSLDYQFFGHLIAADITPDDLRSLGGDGLEELVSDVPTLWVLTELHRLRHQNPEQRFTPTDMNDLRALAVAVVYCDVVVADKAWVHVLNRSGLPDRYGTLVTGNPEDAVKQLNVGS